MSQTIYFNSRQQLHTHLFKVIPHKPNALSYLSLSRFYTLMEGFFWDAPRRRRYSILDGLHAFTMVPFNGPFELREKNKDTRSKIRGIPDAQYTLSRYLLSSKLCSFSYLVIIWSPNDRHTPHAISARCWPQSCLLKASHSWSHFSHDCSTLWTFCTTQNLVISCYLQILLQTEVLQVIVTEFSPLATKNFRFIRFTVLISDRHDKEGVQTKAWKNAMVAAESKDYIHTFSRYHVRW